MITVVLGRRAAPDDEFMAYYAARAEHLRSTAYLLCGDWHLAEDVASRRTARLPVETHSPRDCAPTEEPAQSQTPMGQPWPLDSWPDVPTSVLVGRDDRLFPVDLQIRVSEQRLGITPQVLPGGHLIALSRPASWPTRSPR